MACETPGKQPELLIKFGAPVILKPKETSASASMNDAV